MAGSTLVTGSPRFRALTHEITPGLLAKILRDLGLSRRDLS
jgi:hypothetical protein